MEETKSMDKSNKSPNHEQTSNDQNVSDREQHNPFRYDTGKNEEEMTTDEEAQLEQERKEALTERD